jgi:hypothetical protein
MLSSMSLASCRISSVICAIGTAFCRKISFPYVTTGKITRTSLSWLRAAPFWCKTQQWAGAFWSAVTKTALCAGCGTAFRPVRAKAASRGIPLAAALQIHSPGLRSTGIQTM